MKNSANKRWLSPSLVDATVCEIKRVIYAYSVYILTLWLTLCQANFLFFVQRGFTQNCLYGLILNDSVAYSHIPV